MWFFAAMVFTLAAGGARDRTDRPELYQVPTPAPASNEYRLQPRGDGFRYEEPTFIAQIARDGVVDIQDRRMVLDRFLPQPLPGALPWPSLEWWFFERPHVPFEVPSAVEGPYPESPADPIDYTVLCPEWSTCYSLPGILIVPRLGVRADLTDEIMRDLGQDPYRVQKAAFLAATFEMRIRLAVQTHQDDLRTSLDQLPERLAELWHDQRYSARERRRLLFELWRETDESDAGAQARETIQTFIRRILPCKSAEAYPPAELRALQASEPGRRFSPYGACPR